MKDVEFDMIEIVSSFCDNLKCVQSAYQAAMEETSLGISDLQDVYPNSFESSPVKYHLDKIESTIKSVDVSNANEVIKELKAIQALLREDISISIEDKHVGLAAGSVAIESTKLWTMVFRDPSHPLHVIQEVSTVSKSFFQHRKLQSIQTSGGTDLSYTILADVIAIVAFLGIPFPSIFASLWAFAITNVATQMPSAVSSPSTSPSSKPTSIPSMHPSTHPTIFPSAAPSVFPSAFPTFIPTSFPTLYPSTHPSNYPSLNPTSVPSAFPTFIPTSFPTLHPSQIPTVVPSSIPSTYPTTSPSLEPSSSPSLFPSSFPSLNPTSVPSVAPSTHPTSHPSVKPSLSPTSVPTIRNPKKIVAPDGESNSNFGFSVDICGDKVVVGAHGSGVNEIESGSVYIFTMFSTDIEFTTKLVPPDGEDNDNFGFAVAISNNIVVVGAYRHSNSKGAAYIFSTDGTLISKLEADDGVDDDNFGYSVAVFGDNVLVGANKDDFENGAAYLYTTSGDFVRKLQGFTKEMQVRYGQSVAIGEDSLIVGVQKGLSPTEVDTGSTYLYSSSGDYSLTLTPFDGDSEDFFGNSVAVHGDRIVVGANRDDDNGDSSGSAYIYTSDGTLVTKISAPDDDFSALAEFGRSVAISDDIIAVGAFKDTNENGSLSGAVYLFSIDGEYVDKIIAPDGATGDRFGCAVAISGDLLVVGSFQDDDNGNGSGSSYIYFL